MKKHWAHTTNYEEFVRFVGSDLQEQVLGEYLKYTNSHKNATYLSQNSVSQFTKVISDWMRKETISDVKNCSDFTLLLDESTDESNRSELSLFARIVKDGKVVNHFLDLLHLSRCDAQSIFTKMFKFLQDEKLDIKNTRFAGMDGCSTMSGEHNGVRALFEDATPHFAYIHCRNHRLALCFAHLLPQFEDFKKFDAFLLNLYLLLKHSSIKTGTSCAWIEGRIDSTKRHRIHVLLG